ncbi:transcription termination/antitermination protein NusG [Fusobacterium periodonticum]|uniref:Transcription termination/antitermination protein NusG n=1 Tax=Fusobacterium periodonticum ATCC 33693 TaxID=546275 RepID=D4CW05_9FUSO|nr:transcription termination/antitermination protein NusG [Fusobacterium periodonticum]EFE86419.1 transcription termination/antitermination factor NusG [Fusobacterium periodonticum ATCC 33693]
MSIENVRKWFMIHTYSGYEKKVKTDLEQKVGTLQLRDVVTNILVPEEETTEIVRGKPKKIYRKLFPAYVMLEMEATREENENGISYKVDPDVWYIIRNTNGVTGFVGVGSDPIPMEDDEVKNIFNIIGMDTSKETIKLDFAEGDFVKILKGSFKDQEGQVAEIDYEHGRVKVMVDIFGRMTPVEIEVDGVLKV